MAQASPPPIATTDAYSSDGAENPEFVLTRWPFYWIIRTNDRYLALLEKRLRQIELDIPRWRVLMLLGATDARSVSYLATEAQIKLSTMTRIVQRMEQEGLVETRPRPSDGRVTEVLLTGNGRRARPLAWLQASIIFRKAFEGVSEDELTVLNAILRKIADNLVVD